MAQSIGFNAPSIKSYLDASQNTVTDIAWGVEDTCDLKVWKNLNGCRGIDRPWNFGMVTDSATGIIPTVGNVRAWHYLANKAEDKTKIFSVEKGDTLQALLYVYKDYKYNSGSWTAGTGVGTWTVKSGIVKGAYTTLIGITALILGVNAILF
jgi:hypothetical protein